MNGCQIRPSANVNSNDWYGFKCHEGDHHTLILSRTSATLHFVEQGKWTVCITTQGGVPSQSKCETITATTLPMAKDHAWRIALAFNAEAAG